MTRVFCFVLLSLAFDFAPLQAEDASDLKAFAETFWAAIKSGDPEKAFALYHPMTFEQLTPDELTYCKKLTSTVFKELAARPEHSYTITTQTLPEIPDPKIYDPALDWPAKPEYQIDIQTYKWTESGKEKDKLIISAAIRLDGRFWIISPRPPAQEMARQHRDHENPPKSTGPQKLKRKFY